MPKLSKQKQQQQSIAEKYTLAEQIGEGGNAQVFRAKPVAGGDDVAVKCLVNRSAEKEQRFADEIRIMESCTNIPGVLPVLDKCPEHFWYAMPIATPVMKWSEALLAQCPKYQYRPDVTDRSRWLIGVVECFRSLAGTLSSLHSQGIHHRDIKPDNIYVYNREFCLGDFGLVEFPDKSNNLTRDDKGIGAIFTIAPEMKRDPKHSDGAKADVYSLAKTLWMVLTGDEKGFDGKYSPTDAKHGLRNYDRLKDEYLAEFEQLLSIATDNDPDARPDMAGFDRMLDRWLDSFRNEDKRDASEWKFIAERIFGDNIPVRSEWHDAKAIVRVLNILGASTATNHMMFPNGGGLDFDSAAIAPEPGFIYVISDGFCNVIKPKALYFESFDDSCWNYFMIEAEEVEPIAGSGVSSHGDQELVEDTPGNYVNANDSVYGVYDYDSGVPLPDGWKTVQRFTRGKFLIVMKLSGYNQIPAAYDGRHDVMTNEELRNYIATLQSVVAEGVAQGYEEMAIIKCHEFGVHPYPERAADRFDVPDDTDDEKKLPNPDDFIKDNFQSWDFSSLLVGDKGDGKLKFSFEFKLVAMHSLFEDYPVWYLGVDGRIHEEKEGSPERFEVSDRELAISICEALNSSVYDRCDGYNRLLLNINYRFNIVMRRVAMPTHLFTKEEIAEGMRNADDRLGNQLVIDEDGYAHVLPVNERSIGLLYPVSNCIWPSRHNIVGPYSSMWYLDETYRDMLACWLRYLSSGHRVYCDISSTEDIDSLLREINNIGTYGYSIRK